MARAWCARRGRAGPAAGGLASEVDLGVCPDEQVVEVAAAAVRLQAWAAALEHLATAALLDRCVTWRNVRPSEHVVAGRHVSAEQMAAHELAAALGVSPRSGLNRVHLAEGLRRLPATRAALAAGRLDLYTARTLVELLAVLDDDNARDVETRVLAGDPDRPKARIVESARRAVLTLDPAAAEERHARRVQERGVSVFPLADGMAQAAYVDEADKVHAFHDWVTAQAELGRGADPADAGRTVDQARADVLADIAEHGLAALDLPRRQGRRPQVHVVVRATTLLGLDDQPGELVGYGPIPASMARRIAADATWRRLLTDPRTGRFDELSLTTYEPSQDLRDLVVSRDRTCRGPGCRVPADRCDLDHRIPHPRGPTAPDNLYAACRTFHEIKTLTDTVVTDDGDGGLRVTFPSGRSCRSPAEPVLGDTPEQGADPADVPPF